jgi:hypothetical protein
MCRENENRELESKPCDAVGSGLGEGVLLVGLDKSERLSSTPELSDFMELEDNSDFNRGEYVNQELISKSSEMG